jgi:hypothetical protein
VGVEVSVRAPRCARGNRHLAGELHHSAGEPALCDTTTFHFPNIEVEVAATGGDSRAQAEDRELPLDDDQHHRGRVEERTQGGRDIPAASQPAVEPIGGSGATRNTAVAAVYEPASRSAMTAGASTILTPVPAASMRQKRNALRVPASTTGDDLTASERREREPRQRHGPRAPPAQRPWPASGRLHAALPWLRRSALAPCSAR